MMNFNRDKFESYVENQSQSDYEKCGKEKYMHTYSNKIIDPSKIILLKDSNTDCKFLYEYYTYI